MLFRENPPVSLLYVPASKPRAMAKAAALDADAIILDLEDAVAPDDKIAARAAARIAVDAGMFAGKMLIVRINGRGTPWHSDDVAAFADSTVDALQIPKVESAADVAAVAAAALAKPLLPMIETARGVFAARDIAAHPAAHALVAGLNDLAMDVGVPDPSDRGAMLVAIQMIVLAARAAGKLAYDGVWTGLDDAEGLIAECAQGRRFGFDGKTLIHPNQISACNSAWLPDAAQLAAAHALLAAVDASAAIGAVRHNGKMVEEMHVLAARRMIARTQMHHPNIGQSGLHATREAGSTAA